MEITVDALAGEARQTKNKTMLDALENNPLSAVVLLLFGNCAKPMEIPLNRAIRGNRKCQARFQSRVSLNKDRLKIGPFPLLKLRQCLASDLSGFDVLLRHLMMESKLKEIMAEPLHEIGSFSFCRYRKPHTQRANEFIPFIYQLYSYN